MASNRLTTNLIFNVRGLDALVGAIDEYLKMALHTINEGGFYTHGTVEVSMVYNSTEGVIYFCHNGRDKIKLESIQKSMAFLMTGKDNFFKSFDRHYVDDSYMEDVLYELVNVLINEHIVYEDDDDIAMETTSH
jgi:hypothetical protein